MTNRLTVVEKSFSDLDARTNGLCCMLFEIEDIIRATLKPYCPAGGNTIAGLYRGVIEDARNLICRSPKCKDYLKGKKIERIDAINGLISTTVRIVFTLGV